MTDQADAPQTSDPLGHIEHVIVLMLENRSFDNLLGWLYDEEDPPREQEFEVAYGRAASRRRAPDLGWAPTLDAPRTDKPTVTPLPLPDEGREAKINDLHHLVADIMADRTGRPKPHAKELSEFVHQAYALLFGDTSAS